MQITNNYSVLGLINVQNLKNKENPISAPSFKASEQKLAKVAAGTLAAAAGVVVSKMKAEDDEPDGIKHSLKKEYYLEGQDFDEIAEDTNGSYCGSIIDGMHGITETITDGNKVETTKYDTWGIPEYKKTTVTTQDKETKTNIYYAGDGSVVQETSSVEYFKQTRTLLSG